MSIRKGKPFEEELLLSLINHCIVHKYNISKIKEFIKVKEQELFGQQVLFELTSEDINSGSITELRKNVTLDVSRVDSYLTVVGPFAKRVTRKAKEIGAKVLEKGSKLQNYLTSGR